MSTSSDFSSYINESYASKGESITLVGAIIGKSAVEVVTSATFIFGVFGVLSKLFRK
jgi:hypothetical protein